jgi:nanoRNase/pAp phosphatase (c-di-AMP/oligoRNAs hydrolase)
VLQLSTFRAACSDRLLAVLSGYGRYLVVMHDNPDPDAIASGWAVCCLIEEKLGAPVRLVGGGAIVRAENRHMVELLNPPVELVGEIEVGEDTATVLVDCGVGSTNQLLTRADVRPVAVIDHHSCAPGGLGPAFVDVRPDVVASATIAASYLREQGVDPGPKLATALLLAIRSETRGWEFDYSPLDRSILLWLTERSEPSLLAAIESAPLSVRYFGDLLLAMQGTFLYGDAALCLLPRAYGAEIVGEVADLLIRCEAVRRVLCGAAVGDDLLLSVRTRPDGDNATALLQATLAGLGSGGGHACRAGGKIAGVGHLPGSKITHDLEADLRARWLAACGVQDQSGRPLVPRWEIMDNL